MSIGISSIKAESDDEWNDERPMKDWWTKDARNQNGTPTTQSVATVDLTGASE